MAHHANHVSTSSPDTGAGSRWLLRPLRAKLFIEPTDPAMGNISLVAQPTKLRAVGFSAGTHQQLASSAISRTQRGYQQQHGSTTIIAALNAELTTTFPEPGATHFAPGGLAADVRQRPGVSEKYSIFLSTSESAHPRAEIRSMILLTRTASHRGRWVSQRSETI